MFLDQIVEKDIVKQLGRSRVTTVNDEKEAAKDCVTDPVLVEIGPRFVIDPIRIFWGCIGGSSL
jgi:hypothetical protein